MKIKIEIELDTDRDAEEIQSLLDIAEKLKQKMIDDGTFYEDDE